VQREYGSDNIPDGHSNRAGNTQTRRRGPELEAAILDAAWEQLLAEGYEHFTIDTVTARARTGKPVLYRRWKDPRRPAARHRPPPRRRRLAAQSRHRHPPG
jgi:hypothetical protein